MKHPVRRSVRFSARVSHTADDQDLIIIHDHLRGNGPALDRMALPDGFRFFGKESGQRSEDDHADDPQNGDADVQDAEDDGDDT